MINIEKGKDRGWCTKLTNSKEEQATKWGRKSDIVFESFKSFPKNRRATEVLWRRNSKPTDNVYNRLKDVPVGVLQYILRLIVQD